MNQWLTTSLTKEQFGMAVIDTFKMVSVSFVLGSLLGLLL